MNQKILYLSRALRNSVNFATGASWTQTAHECAIKMNKPEVANKLLKLHKMALERSNFNDVNKELTSFYTSQYNLKNS
jgi:hypothetical protein